MDHSNRLSCSIAFFGSKQSAIQMGEYVQHSDVQIVGILHTKLIYITVFLPNKSKNSKNILCIYEKFILLKRDLNYFKK